MAKNVIFIACILNLAPKLTCRAVSTVCRFTPEETTCASHSIEGSVVHKVAMNCAKNSNFFTLLELEPRFLGLYLEGTVAHYIDIR